MDEKPHLSHVLIPTSLGCFFGLIIGVVLAWDAPVQYRKYIITAGIVVVGMMFWRLSAWFLDRLEGWGRYYEYGNDTPGIMRTNDDKVVLSLVVVDDKGNRMSKEIHDLTLDEWRQLGAGVVRYNYEYSSRKLQAIFTPSRGATIYEIITPKLKDRYIGVLIDSGNGVSVTQGRGERFFEQLKKGDYEILRVLDTPPSPTEARDTA